MPPIYGIISARENKMTKSELKENWKNILQNLYSSMESLPVNIFFSPLEPVKLSERELKIYFTPPKGGSSSFYQKRIENYQKELSSACESVFGKAYNMEVVDSAPIDTEDSPVPEDPSFGFNPRYTFDSFVQGPNNQLALAACLAIADKGFVREYNPLFIYSGAGLGKTHLMHAVGQYVIKKYPKKRVMYVSSEAFTNELVKSLQEKRQEDFRNKYRKVDLLLFDDVQFISGKQATQEELFHTFESLYNFRKQIIFTSDKPPKDLDGIPERLQSRFGWGMPVDIQAPDYETRLAILKNLAILSGVTITDEVNEMLQVISQNIITNIRDLEGAWNRVHGMAKLQNLKMSPSMAKKVLTDIFDTKKTTLTPQSIKKCVAKYFGFKSSDLESKKRNQSISFPRQIAIYLIRENTNSSYPQIGEMFGGRNHSTILHSYNNISKAVSKDDNLRNTIDNIMEILHNS